MIAAELEVSKTADHVTPYFWKLHRFLANGHEVDGKSHQGKRWSISANGTRSCHWIHGSMAAWVVDQTTKSPMRGRAV